MAECLCDTVPVNSDGLTTKRIRKSVDRTLQFLDDTLLAVEKSKVHTHTQTHIYTHTQTHIYTYTHTHIHTHAHTYTHAHIHTYAHTYMHMHSHTYNTHTHTRTLYH